MDAKGYNLFGPEVRQATKDLFASRPNPIIDQLRAECLAIEAEDA